MASLTNYSRSRKKYVMIKYVRNQEMAYNTTSFEFVYIDARLVVGAGASNFNSIPYLRKGQQ